VREELVAVYVLIGLRALADCDSAEYVRVSDLSKGELDLRIASRLAAVRFSDDLDRRDAVSRFEQLTSILKDAKGNSELNFLLRQLHMACLQRAQQLSLSIVNSGAPRPARENPRAPGLAASPAARRRVLSDDHLRLGVMRLLRELPGYSPVFEYAVSSSQVDCVLEPPADGGPAIVVEAKVRLVAPSEAASLVKTLRKYVGLWGKGTLAVILASEISAAVRDSLTKEKDLYLLDFDQESNAFREPGVQTLTTRVRAAYAR